MFNPNDEVQLKESYHSYHVLKARKNQRGTILESVVMNNTTNTEKFPGYKVMLSNGKTVNIPEAYLVPYEKKAAVRLEDYTNEGLLGKYEELLTAEFYAKSTQSKTFKKIQKDKEKVRSILLERLNS